MVMKLFPEALIDSFYKSDRCPLEGPEVGKANNCCRYLVRRYVVEREMHETEQTGKRAFLKAMNIKLNVEEHYAHSQQYYLNFQEEIVE